MQPLADEFFGQFDLAIEKVRRAHDLEKGFGSPGPSP
jgi:hypothetical protein